MSDLIDRQSAISIVTFECGKWTGLSKEINKQIQNLPSVKPERKNGKWIQDGHHIQCNQCGISICDKDREGDVLPKKFCPNCGSYNGEEEGDAT